MRRELKRESKRPGCAYNILEKAIKLTLNALYGKQAQGVSGGKGDRHPPLSRPYDFAAGATLQT